MAIFVPSNNLWLFELVSITEKIPMGSLTERSKSTPKALDVRGTLSTISWEGSQLKRSSTGKKAEWAYRGKPISGSGSRVQICWPCRSSLLCCCWDLTPLAGWSECQPGWCLIVLSFPSKHTNRDSRDVSLNWLIFAPNTISLIGRWSFSLSFLDRSFLNSEAQQSVIKGRARRKGGRRGKISRKSTRLYRSTHSITSDEKKSSTRAFFYNI